MLRKCHELQINYHAEDMLSFRLTRWRKSPKLVTYNLVEKLYFPTLYGQNETVLIIIMSTEFLL